MGALPQVLWFTALGFGSLNVLLGASIAGGSFILVAFTLFSLVFVIGLLLRSDGKSNKSVELEVDGLEVQKIT